MNQDLVKHLIQYKFDPLQIAVAFLVDNSTGELAPLVKQYLQTYPIGASTVQQMINYGILEVYPGQEVNMDNARIAPGYKQTKSDLMEMANEFWEKYPAAFPLDDGKVFIARKGHDKTLILKEYLERINASREKHEFVLQQLSIYSKLVLDKRINGHRIQDWVSNEMWDTVPAINAASRGEFNTDI